MSKSIRAILSETIEFVDSLGGDFSARLEEFRRLQSRLLEERFHLAVLGQFKRGKSTLINALLGEDLMPSSVLPLTAIPTFISGGEAMQAKVIYLDGRKDETLEGGEPRDLTAFLSRFVTEDANPGNRLRVSRVEVLHPSEVLRKGLVIIDTPGIGSTYRHNTEMTLNFLPQCDAALFVVSADPPVTEIELEFLKEVRPKLTRLFFVLNKIDYLDKPDQDRVVNFFRKILSDKLRLNQPPLFSVSAKQGLEAKKLDDRTLWEKSGVAGIEHHLVDFLAREKGKALEEAIARRTENRLQDLLMQARLAARAIRMPVAQLEEKSRWFKQKVNETETQLMSERDLLEGDEKRVLEHLEQSAENLRRAARNYLRGAIENSMALHEDNWSEEAAQKAMAEVIPSFFEHEMGKLTTVEKSRTVQVLQAHEERINGLNESVRKAAAGLFDLPYHPLSFPAFQEKARKPSWETRKWVASFELIPEGFMDRLLPSRVRKEKILRRVVKKMEYLVALNVEEIRWPLLQHTQDTFWKFGTEMDNRFKETIQAIERAIGTALRKKEELTEDASGRMSSLEACAGEIERICKELKEIQQ